MVSSSLSCAARLRAAVLASLCLEISGASPFRWKAAIVVMAAWRPAPFHISASRRPALCAALLLGQPRRGALPWERPRAACSRLQQLLADRLRAGAAPWHCCQVLLSRGAGRCFGLWLGGLPVEIDACVVSREGYKTCGVISRPVRGGDISLAPDFEQPEASHLRAVQSRSTERQTAILQHRTPDCL